MYKALYLLGGVIVFSSCCMYAMDGGTKKVGIGGAGNNSLNSIVKPGIKTVKNNNLKSGLASSPQKCAASGGNHIYPFQGNIGNKKDCDIPLER